VNKKTSPSVMTVATKAAILLPLLFVTAPIAAQQKVDNPAQQETYEEPEVVPDELIFSESRFEDEAQAANEEDALTIFEPMYFIAGGNANGSGDFKARFQISFKYQIFSDEGAIAEFLPLLKNLKLGYTQTSLWNLAAVS